MRASCRRISASPAGRVDPWLWHSEDPMLTLRLLDRPLLLGFFLGLVFGIVDLLFTWFQPLSDDSIPLCSGSTGRCSFYGRLCHFAQYAAAVACGQVSPPAW